MLDSMKTLGSLCEGRPWEDWWGLFCASFVKKEVEMSFYINATDIFRLYSGLPILDQPYSGS